MGKLPFDLIGRQGVEGGMLLFFTCRGCGGEATLFLRSGDSLTGKYPLACACGQQINFYFGSPLLGRSLLRSLRDLSDPPPGPRPSPCLN